MLDPEVLLVGRKQKTISKSAKEGKEAYKTETIGQLEHDV